MPYLVAKAYALGSNVYLDDEPAVFVAEITQEMIDKISNLIAARKAAIDILGKGELGEISCNAWLGDFYPDRADSDTGIPQTPTIVDEPPECGNETESLDAFSVSFTGSLPWFIFECRHKHTGDGIFSDSISLKMFEKIKAAIEQE